MEITKEKQTSYTGLETSPIDEIPTKPLSAKAIRPGAQPLLFGYDVESDLAQHYSFAELIFLSLTGVVPGPDVGRAFEQCLFFLGPVSVAQGPTHAAALCSMIGTSPSGIISIGTTALSEQARFTIAKIAPLIDWLEHPEKSFPAEFVAAHEEERESVARLKKLLQPTGLEFQIFSHDPSPLAAIIGTIWQCGLHNNAQLESALVLARLPFLLAESFSFRPRDLCRYPINLPKFSYTEEQTA